MWKHIYDPNVERHSCGVLGNQGHFFSQCVTESQYVVEIGIWLRVINYDQTAYMNELADSAHDAVDVYC